MAAAAGGTSASPAIGAPAAGNASAGRGGAAGAAQAAGSRSDAGRGAATAGAAGKAPNASGSSGTAAPYEVVIADAVRIQSHEDEPNFQQAIRSVDFGTGPFAKATLSLELATTCVPFSSWDRNPPPQGQSWPADCDRFDRNFEVVLDPPRSANEPAGVELVRAITPYGGPMQLEVDVTDIANARPGPHRIRIYIATWSDAMGAISGSHGGWNVSARLRFEPGAAPRNVLALIPLFDGTIEPAQRAGQWPFTMPDGAEAVRFEYRATGHGGAQVSSRACIGAAEEFCRREHVLSLDGTAFARLDAWREDCGDPCTIEQGGPEGRYCRENPCRAIANVTNPRANWCPGKVTPPLIEATKFGALGPGAHEVRYEIPGFTDGGIWRLSAHLLVFGAK